MSPSDYARCSLKDIEKLGRAEGRLLQEKCFSQMPLAGEEVAIGLVDGLMGEIVAEWSGREARLRATGLSERQIEAWRTGCRRGLKRFRTIYTKVL
jgi:hypothetical protein